MNKIVPFLIMIIISTWAHAGINGLTIHSRANCVNNESITWDARWYRTYQTISQHFLDGKLQHEIITDWEDTWRSAAIHWGEGKGGWYVCGLHWMRDEETEKLVYIGNTSVNDCSIYDGWWDTQNTKSAI